MRVVLDEPWPVTVPAAVRVQDRLRSRVDTASEGPATVRTVAGLDVAYRPGSDLLAAAVVVLDAETLDVVDRATAVARARFPYVPGFFAFRELPPLVDALGGLTVTPDLLVCDGHGLAHPRRFGLACHLGVLTDVPTIGVAKTAFVGEHPPVPAGRGGWAPLTDGGDVVGRVLRTRAGVSPVFVSVGHRIGLDRACAHVLRLCPRYRLPETTSAADQLCRAVLAGVA